jgi:hypothetical protein
MASKKGYAECVAVGVIFKTGLISGVLLTRAGMFLLKGDDYGVKF